MAILKADFSLDDMVDVLAALVVVVDELVVDGLAEVALAVLAAAVSSSLAML